MTEEHKQTPTKEDLKSSGVYLYLFHGRNEPGAELNDWGDGGPVFGPFPFVQTTYANEIKLGYEDEELHVCADLIFYDGKYYGDWSVISAHIFEITPALQQCHQEFEQDKAQLPAVPTAGQKT